MNYGKEFNRYEDIQRYVDGTLSLKNLYRFELDLNADPKLVEEVKIYKKLFIFFEEDEAKKKLRATLQNIRYL